MALSPEGRERIVAANRGRTHSALHRSRVSVALRGGKNPQWKGGKTISRDGYVMIRVPSHPRAEPNGYVREHILVYEAAYGSLGSGLVVHHRNGDNQDNRLENLQALTPSEHMKLHRIPTNSRWVKIPRIGGRG